MNRSGMWVFMKDLENLRNHLEMCDDIILDTLKMRYQIVEDITNYKKHRDMQIVHLDEDARKDEHAKERMAGVKYGENILNVYNYIRYTSKVIQSMNVFDYNIFLIGFMGVGKSTISATLHDIFAMDVVEMDQEISQKNNMSISEIFDVYGEEYFRNEETNLLREARNSKNQIISCGGGVPMRDVNVAEMKKSGKVILLTATPETILKRVETSHDRPLLENNKTVEYISELMEKRREKYEAAADIVINTDGKSALEICEDIIASAKSFA